MANARRRTTLWLTIFGLLYAAAIIASYTFRARGVDAVFEGLAASSARAEIQQVIASRRWNASLGGVYALVDSGAMPNPYLTDPLRDVTTAEGLALTKINPAYMTRLIAETLAKEQGLRIHLTSLKPINPGNRGDAFEQAALARFEQGAPEVFALDAAAEGGPRFRFMSPLKTDKPCLNCHAVQGYTLGSVRGGVTVDFSYAPYADAAAKMRRELLLSHLTAFLAGALLLTLVGLLLDEPARA